MNTILAQLPEEAWKTVPQLCVFGLLMVWLVKSTLNHAESQRDRHREEMRQQIKDCEDRLQEMNGQMRAVIDRNTKALDRNSAVTEGARELLRKPDPPSPS